MTFSDLQCEQLSGPHPGKTSYVYFWAIVGAVIILDQVSKWLVLDYLDPYGGEMSDIIVLIPNSLNIIRVHNTGAAWSIFSGYPKLLGGLGLIALGCIYYFRKLLEIHMLRMQIIFGLLCGGIIGNMIDRFRFGFVIDFIDIILPFYRWPTFNIADCAISISIFWYIIFSVFTEKRQYSKGQD